MHLEVKREEYFCSYHEPRELC